MVQSSGQEYRLKTPSSAQNPLFCESRLPGRRYPVFPAARHARSESREQFALSRCIRSIAFPLKPEARSLARNIEACPAVLFQCLQSTAKANFPFTANRSISILGRFNLKFLVVSNPSEANASSESSSNCFQSSLELLDSGSSCRRNWIPFSGW